mgnify:CR=1 FL=1
MATLTVAEKFFCQDAQPSIEDHGLCLLNDLCHAATKVGCLLTCPDSSVHANALALLARGFVRWDADMATAAAALEAAQRAKRFEPLLTAAQLQLLGTLLALAHYSACIQYQAEMQQAGQQVEVDPRNLKAAAMAASLRLLQLQPGSAAALCIRASIQSQVGATCAEQAAAWETALQAAEGERSWSLAAACAAELAGCRMTGGGNSGGADAPTHVQPLIGQAKAALARCRPWLLHGHADAVVAKLDALRQALHSEGRGIVQQGAPAVHPFHLLATSESPPGQGGWAAHAVDDRPTCAACSRQVAVVKRCTACRTAAYCSTACQRSHWPQHKAECRRLAAERAGEPAVQS